MERKPRSIKICIAQLGNSFNGEHGEHYLPYAAGVFQEYIKKYSKNPHYYEFLLPLYKRLPVDACLSHLKNADIAAFSAYQWNFKMSIEVARRLKELYPEKLVIFGGPHVPDHAEGFFKKYPFIDVVVHGEGEQVFLSLVESYPGNKWGDILGISYINHKGEFSSTPKGPRMKDLSRIPSPYVEGTFKPLMEANPNENWITMWETNRGCPFACTFCDWGSLVNAKVYPFDMERCLKELDWFSEHKIGYVFCCDANFGILARDVDLAKYIAEIKKETGYPQIMCVQNTKNQTERSYETQKTLFDAGFARGVLVAFQSVDQATLIASKRGNISLESFAELKSRFAEEGIPTSADFILGLPGESYETFVNGLAGMVEDGNHNRARVNNLHILPNAEMGDPEYQAKYGMKSIEGRTVNIHGILKDIGDIYETHELVIETKTMPSEAWRKALCFGWMLNLMHFNKLLQIPLLVANGVGKTTFSKLIEAILEVDSDRFPTLVEIKNFLMDTANRIQNGAPEYVHSENYLGIYWHVDEYLFIKLNKDCLLNQFYSESRELFSDLVGERVPKDLLDDAFKLNEALLKKPFKENDVTIDLSYDILPYYWDRLIGKENSIVNKPVSYKIKRSKQVWNSWSLWMKEVVWYCYNSATYFYGDVESLDLPFKAEKRAESITVE